MNSDITTDLIGVGATIAGTVLGWVLNNLSNRGKLNFYVSSWEDKFQCYGDIGEMVSCSKREEVQSYTYKVSFDLYNSSGNTKIMRNIKIVFSDGKNDIKVETPKDDATKRFSSPMIFYDDVKPINIPPKAVIKLDLHNESWNKEGELDYIWKTKKVYLIYNDEKNKTKRTFIKSEDYENYFINHKLEEKDNGQAQDANSE